MSGVLELAARFKVEADDYLDAVSPCEDRHVDAVARAILRVEKVPPTPAAFRLMVDEVARVERARAETAAAHARDVLRKQNLAPPWHARLWASCFAVLLAEDHLLPPRYRPYIEIVKRAELRPEMALDWANREEIVDACLDAAEKVWIETGETDTAEAAAREAFGLMIGAGKR